MHEQFLRHLWIVLLVLVSACSPSYYRQSAQVPPEVFNAPAPAEAQALWAQAESAYLSGNLVLAINTWERIANSFPTNAIAARSLSRIGKLYLSKGKPDPSLKYFDAIIDNFPQWYETAFTQIDRVEALWAAGNHSTALDEATKLWQSAYPDAEFRVRLCAFLAQANADNQMMPSAIEWLDRGLAKAQTNDQNNRMGQTAVNLLEPLDQAAVQQLLATTSSGNVRAYLEYRLARIQMEQGNQDAARQQLLQILAHYPKHPVTRQIRALFNQGVMTAILPLHPDRIGCLLPLTGAYAAFGRQVLRGLALAVENWNASHAGRPVSLIVKDTKAQPAKAARAYQSLAEDYGVLAIVGPLSAKCTNSLSAATGKYGIPLLTFTQRESVETGSPFIFHLLIDNRGMVERLVRYCHDQLSYDRFAILYPKDRYGRRLSGVFAEAVQELGIQAVAQVSYQPGTTDFKQAIHDLLQQAGNNPYSRGGKSAIEALFIPDQAQTVALIAPQLPYYNMISPTLLGTNLWDDPALLKIGGVYVENALFATAFPLTDSSATIAGFRDQFQQAYGATPHYFEAQAYDTVTALLTARDLTGVSTVDRVSLQQNLLSLSLTDNLTGIVAFLPDGTLERDYVIYRIENGTAVQATGNNNQGSF